MTKLLSWLVPDEGIEPPTFGLQNRCSTAELIRHCWLSNAEIRRLLPGCYYFCPPGGERRIEHAVQSKVSAVTLASNVKALEDATSSVGCALFRRRHAPRVPFEDKMMGPREALDRISTMIKE